MKAQERALRHTRGKGKWRAIALAVGFHALFLGLIFFGVRWQTQTPEAVQVEIVSGLVSPPNPEPKVEPKPEPEPEPVAKPVPKIEPKVEKKPDIVTEKPKVKPPKIEKPEPEEVKPDKVKEAKEAKEKAAKDKAALEKTANEKEQAKAKEVAAREQSEENAQKMIRDLQKQAGAAVGVAKGATTGTPDPNWEGRVKGAIKRNTVFSSTEVEGNPEAVFKVDLNPDCSLRGVRLVQSSKSSAWDQAAERAIRRTDPFPKPAGQDCRAQETIGHRPE
jgi:colicin import membrane protein